MDNKRTKELEKFLNSLDIKFSNLEIYNEAFMHSSYINENKNLDINSYDRLEFLGDSVLGLLTSLYLFHKDNKNSAGFLSFYRSKVIRKDFLASISKNIGFGKFILLGKGGKKDKIAESIYEDVFESFIGAIYLDLGLEDAKKYLNKYFFSEVDKVRLDDLKDNKTKLQEHLQAHKKNPVSYVVKSNVKNKKTNKTIFEVEAIVDGVTFGKGKGTTKKEAEQDAALEAYNKMIN